MTLPNERTRAVQSAREFLRRLLDRSATPGVPLEIRKSARSVLKHFPGNCDLIAVAKKSPKTFAPPKEEDDA